MSAWTDHVAKWKDCELCPLWRQRNRICIARGTVPCDVLFIGEAPGASEDAIGKPFIGPAGRLLDQIIERALPAYMKYAFTNLVCCFPAEAKAEGINEPHGSEIKACRPRLYEFINIAQPQLIVCVGALAADHIDHRAGIQCVDVIHPAAILRMPLAQKQMAAQRVIVQLRNAAESITESSRPNFTKWGDQHASIPSERERVRSDYDDWARSPTDADIPF